MNSAWVDLEAECAAWQQDGLGLRFWWRDDDATKVTPQLQALMDLSDRHDVPVHLAIISKYVDDSLVKLCLAKDKLVPLVHGWAHMNHAPTGDKKAEFNHVREDLCADASAGLSHLQILLGEKLLPCFVPPWNRIIPELIESLPDIGYTALSRFKPRRGRSVSPNLVEINTHIDPIDWRGGGGLADTDTLLGKATSLLRDQRQCARSQAKSDPIEPLGLLTHHLVQDAETWAFSNRLLRTLLDGGAQPIHLHHMRDNLP